MEESTASAAAEEGPGPSLGEPPQLELPLLLDSLPADGEGYVYFVQAGDETGPIKIGWTRRLEARLNTLQTASSQFLTLLKVVPGSRRLEQGLHVRFGQFRMKGEWFRPHADLLTFLGLEASGRRRRQHREIPLQPKVTIDQAIQLLRAEVGAVGRKRPMSRATLDRWIAAGRIRAWHYEGDQHTYVNLDDIRRAWGQREGGKRTEPEDVTTSKITLTEAVRQAGVPERTLYRWIRRGKVPSYHKQGDPHTYVDLADVRAAQGWKEGGRRTTRRAS